MIKIAIGSDHGGFKLKEEVKKLLIDLNHTVEDVGCHSPEPVDYPDIAKAVSNKIIENDFAFGVLICGTGIGMSIAVNRNRRIQ